MNCFIKHAWQVATNYMYYQTIYYFPAIKYSEQSLLLLLKSISKTFQINNNLSTKTTNVLEKQHKYKIQNNKADCNLPW